MIPCYHGVMREERVGFAHQMEALCRIGCVVPATYRAS